MSCSGWLPRASGDRPLLVLAGHKDSYYWELLAKLTPWMREVFIGVMRNEA